MSAGSQPITVSNTYAEIAVVPAIGGRVVQLTDRLRETEWLVPAPVRRREPASTHASWADSPRGGWDECLPSIDPAKVGDRWCNDHGDLWALSWELTATQQHEITTRVTAPDDDYTMTRSIALNGPEVRIEYDLQATGKGQLSYLWSMHPLLRVPTDVRRTLPRGTEVVVAYCTDERVRPGTLLRWGQPVDELDQWVVGTVPHGPLAMKLFAHTPAEPVVVTRESAGLSFSLDPQEVPFVGLWLNYGAWPSVSDPDTHVAIEPTSAATDDLAAAQANRQARVLRRGGRHQWSVTLTMEGAH
jgi:galactose mutarotase-like enzyme